MAWHLKSPLCLQLRIQRCLLQIERHGNLFNSAVLSRFPILWTAAVKMTKVNLTALLASFATLAQAAKLTNPDYDVMPGRSFTIEWVDADGAVSIRLKSVATAAESSPTTAVESVPTTTPPLPSMIERTLLTWHDIARVHLVDLVRSQ